MSDEQSIKVYVRVGVVFNDDGRMMPRFICWEDGVKYRIDRVAEISQAVAQRCGGQGDRYTALVIAPLGVLANRKFFLPRTKGLMLRSARLLLISSLPSSR